MKVDPEGTGGRPGPRGVGPAPGPTRLFAVPGFAPLFASSWLWHVTRWGGLFASSYLVAVLTDAPLLNQLVGAALFAPLLVGGLVAGALSDRLDRRRLVGAVQLALLVPAVAMAVVVVTGRVQVWMILLYTALLGVGGLVDLTATRPLIYEAAGPRFAARALSLETVGMASASTGGALAGGAVIGALGVGALYALLVGALVLAAVGLRRSAREAPVGPVRRAVPIPVPVPVPVPARHQLRASVGLFRSNPTLVSMLGVTVVMNACYFSFVPLVPVVVEGFGAGPVVTGAVAGAAGLGQLVAGLTLAARRVAHPGRVYAAGTALALVGLGLFAAAPGPGPAVAALLGAGAGQAGFAAMQSLLAIEAAGRAHRGAALGLLGTAIGALPLGMVALGGLAQVIGPRPALAASSLTGLGVLAGWLRWRPQVLAPPGCPGRGRRRS